MYVCIPVTTFFIFFREEGWEEALINKNGEIIEMERKLVRESDVCLLCVLDNRGQRKTNPSFLKTMVETNKEKAKVECRRKSHSRIHRMRMALRGMHRYQINEKRKKKKSTHTNQNKSHQSPATLPPSHKRSTFPPHRR